MTIEPSIEGPSPTSTLCLGLKSPFSVYQEPNGSVHWIWKADTIKFLCTIHNSPADGAHSGQHESPWSPGVLEWYYYVHNDSCRAAWKGAAQTSWRRAEVVSAEMSILSAIRHILGVCRSCWWDCNQLQQNRDGHFHPTIPPATTKLRLFLGFSSYYWRFVEWLAKIATSLTKYLKNNKDSVGTHSTSKPSKGPWKPETYLWIVAGTMWKSVPSTKSSMTNALGLAYADPFKPYELHVDTSREGLGGVL